MVLFYTKLFALFQMVKYDEKNIVFCPALNSFTAREKIEPEIERRSRQNSNGMPLKFLAGKSRKDETFLASHTVNAEPYGLKMPARLVG